jgi:hypothetical protein
MMVAILQWGVAMAVGLGDRMNPVVIHNRNWASDCILPWTVPFLHSAVGF